jgi:hypothetical protein
VSQPAILFVTYYRVAPVGQLGVFKRCCRMMEVLLDDLDVHLMHFGGLPQGDAEFAAVSERVAVHEIPGDGGGAAIEHVMRSVRPEAVIFGEAPLRGPFRLSHRIATSLRLWQVGIENVFDRNFPTYARSEWPDIDRWLFFGMFDSAVPARLSPESAVVPPLLRFPPGFGSFERDRISVIAYDRQTLLTAARLLHLLPEWQRIDFFVSSETRKLMEERCVARDRSERRVLEFPDGATIYDSLSRARLVFGKAGYGQIVESLQLGARIVCRSCPGGISDGLLAAVMRPYVLILRADHELPGRLPLIEEWLASPPIETWSGVAAQFPDTIALAGRTLAELIEEGRTAPRTPRTRAAPAAPMPDESGQEYPRALSLFAWFVENKQWADLRCQLSAATIWTFDRPLATGEFIAMLESMFADAVDLKFLKIGPMTKKLRDGLFHISQTCALMWGERASWSHHELTFDIHLACRNDPAEEKLAYLGLTSATPEPEAYVAADP